MTGSQFIWSANSHIDRINSLRNEFTLLVDFSKQVGRTFFRRLANYMALILQPKHVAAVYSRGLNPRLKMSLILNFKFGIAIIPPAFTKTCFTNSEF